MTTTRRLFATVSFLACGVLLSYAPACGTHSHDPPAADGVVYEGGTNDEALAKLDDAKPTTDRAKGPVFTSPAQDATLPSTPVPTFAWKASATALVDHAADRRLADFTSGSRGERTRPPPSEATGFPDAGGTSRPRVRGPFADFPLGAERAAYAHGPPLSGRAYRIVFSTDASERVLRVFTTATTYSPDAASWAKLRATNTKVTATITTASYDVNNLVQDVPLITGAPLTFIVQP